MQKQNKPEQNKKKKWESYILGCKRKQKQTMDEILKEAKGGGKKPGEAGKGHECRETMVRITLGFWSETMQTRREWREIVKMLRGKKTKSSPIEQSLSSEIFLQK